MCAIVGILAEDRRDLVPLQAMITSLRHRGPDDEGYLLADSRQRRVEAFRGPDSYVGIPYPPLPAEPPPGFDLGLGHRRLSIIDLSPAGHGPMASADGRLWITYNGEVFNYKELRQELRGRGHEFRSESDTEVLLAAYAEWGEGCLDRLNGMFAFAVYDAGRNRLFAARDRYGIKPFYYHHQPGRLLVFASEIKALLCHPAVPCRPHQPTVLGFLKDGAIDESEQTFFEDILALPGGHSLALDLASRTPSVRRWYQVPDGPPERCSAEEFRELLEDAVRLRLRSDVDVGTCLSGGLDSSSLVGLTARLRDPSGSGYRRSVSVVYADPGIDERDYVSEVVALFGVEASRATPTSEELLRDLPRLVRHQDEPFPSLAKYSQWRVMDLAAAQGLRVLLDGQGSDELLGGYHYHFGPYLAERWARDGLRSALGQARAARAVTGRPLAFFLALMSYHALPAPRALRGWAIGRLATQGRVPARLFDPLLVRQVGHLPVTRHARRPSLRAEREAAVFRSSLPALLRYEDRSSMAFSIEARTPFLDFRLVERALRLPADELIRDGWTKRILREAMKGTVPESVRLRRDKLGYATPEERWLFELAEPVRGWLGREARVAGFFRDGALSAWLSGSDRELADRRGLWRLVAVELWLRYLEGRGREPST